MIRRGLVRSGLQLAGLCLAGFLLSATTAHADEEWCQNQAVSCAAMCGTSVSWGVLYSYYDAYHTWDPVNQVWIGGMTDVWGATFGSGVENFECNDVAQTYWCQCVY
jgi:hypothetical protein